MAAIEIILKMFWYMLAIPYLDTFEHIVWGSFGDLLGPDDALHLLWDPKRKPLAHKIFDGDLGKNENIL